MQDKTILLVVVAYMMVGNALFLSFFATQHMSDPKRFHVVGGMFVGQFMAALWPFLAIEIVLDGVPVPPREEVPVCKL
jgi:hypothetical protein